jgi:hypothetical protein
MATFKDPIGTLTFELPAGWAYDQLYSTLTDFSFVRWDNTQEILVVHLRRAAVKADSSDEEWIVKIREEVGEQKELLDMDSPNGRAFAVDFVSAQEMTQRVAFIRGEYVDIAIEQRNADRDALEPWGALSRVVKTAASGANLPQEGAFGPVEFNKTVEAANTAFEKKDYEAVSQSLEEAIRIGTIAWLSSLTSTSGAPEINAAVRVAQAMVHLGRFTGNPFPSRDAASILRRALCSLEAAGKEVAEQAKGLIDELKEILKDIESEFLDKKDSEESRDSAPVITIRERGLRLGQAGAMAFDAEDFESASVYARAAVEDLLFLMAYFRRGRAQQIPDEILKHLVDQGISDQEEQRDAIQKAREGMLFPALNLSLQIYYCCAQENKDAEAAREAAQLYLPLARQIAESSPGDTSIELNVVLALLDSVGAIASHQDGEQLQDIEAYLEEAAQILEGIGDKQCQDDGWVRNNKQQVERSLEALNQWLAAAKGDSEESLPVDLQSLLSKFDNISKQLGKKIIREKS